MLDWQWPLVFFVLPAPIAVRRFLPESRIAERALRVPFFDAALAAKVPQHQIRSAASLKKTIAILFWVSMVVASARPVWFGDPVSITTSGRDLLLALDVSDSMRIDDMIESDGSQATRMSVIKRVAGEFINRRSGDRIGLVIFGQHSYLQSPLTHDRKSVAIQLQEALPGFAGSSTAIGDAMGMAIKLLRDRPAEGRVLILLTDGANTAGSDPAKAMSIAAEVGVRIHTIGVGANHLQINDGSGRTQQIDPSRDLDETTLQSIATMTGGQFFRARDPAELEQIYARIDDLEPIPDVRKLRPQLSLYHWPLTVALLCAVLLVIANSRRPI